MTLSILRFAVDSLDVSFTGAVYDDVAGALDRAKAVSLDTPHPYVAGLTELMVQGKAFGFWRWRLVCPEYSIVIKRGGVPGGVTAQVSLSAWGLSHNDLGGLWGAILLTFSALGDFTPLNVARCDVCVDFQGWSPTPADLAGMVCPAEYRATMGTEKQVQTFYYGRGDSVLRIYNKTVEIEVSHKYWLRDLWAQCAEYEPSDEVFRVEIQLRRPVLRELDIDTVEHVIARHSAILDYGLTWANLRVPTGDSTKARWPEDPRWSELRHAVSGGTPLQRIPRVSNLMSLERAKSSLIGLAATAGAYFETTDFIQALQKLSMAAEAHMMTEDIDFAARVEEKRCRVLSGDS